MPKSFMPSGSRSLEGALERLRPIEREVLSLSAKEGLRNVDIAARLDLPVAVVERILADALFRLDRHLERPWWKLR